MIRGNRARMSRWPISAGGLPAPASLVGLWYSDTLGYSATPRPYVANQSAPAAAAGAITLGPPARRQFANTTYWGNATTTITDANAAAPDGSNDASTFVGTGNWFLSTQAHPVLSAGASYTICATARTSSGTAQFAQKFFTSSKVSPTRTATTTAQRFAFTATVNGGAEQILPVCSFDGATGATLIVTDVEIFAGTQDLNLNALAGQSYATSGHMLLGKCLGDTTAQPVFAGGFLDFSTQINHAVAQLPTSTWTNGVTTVALIKKVANNSGAYQGAIGGLGNNYTNFTAFAEQASMQAFFLGGAGNILNAGSSLHTGTWNLFGKGWHTLSHRYDPVAQRADLFFDDAKFFSNGVTVSMAAQGDFSFWNINQVNTVGYAMVACALYNTVLTDAQVRQAVYFLQSKYNSLSVGPFNTDRYIAFEGDSITAGTASNSYPYLYQANMNPVAYCPIWAVSGALTSDLIARAPFLDAMIPPNKNGRRYILSVLATNTANNGTAAAYITEMQGYLTARRNARWDKIIMHTLTPKASTTYNANRATINAQFRTWVGTVVDAVVDYDNSVNASNYTDAAGSNATLYPDGIHPSLAVQTDMETVARPVLNAA